MSAAGAARAAAAAGLALAAGRRLRRAVADGPVPGGRERWERTNHRGDAVTLLEGPVAALAAAAGCLAAPGRWRAAGLVALTGGALLGAVDDLAERRGERDAGARGLRGHLAALRAGRLTTGAVKVAGLAATGLAVAALTEGAGPVRSAGPARATGPGGTGARVAGALVAGALVAGSANLLNLFDLRPGRALKVVLLAAAPLAAGPAAPLAAAATGSAAAVLGDDLAGRSMLGDTGANALGALLGTAVLARCGPRGRGAVLAVVVALTLLSERVSFTRVIEAVPALRELDRLGRP
ncbi:hypothetical protein [Kineococcus terrestris]|uniref:hypothetical protein n=1 Tax=Kineococcus terrestris TaxID=2044856 RepID=UPI0034DB08BC